MQPTGDGTGASREFTGQTALVTGASRGVGAATAIALAQHGAARVIVHYNSYPEGADRTLTAIRAAGAQTEAIQADLSTTAGIHGFIAQLKAREVAANILVNNAGSIVQRARLLEMGEDLFDAVMNLNYKSSWMIAQALTPHMIEQGRGVIVNLSSISARTGGGIGSTVYAASKGAVLAMTKGLAKELAPKGIRVNAVSPGTVDNYFHEQFSTREALEKVIASTPAGRLATNEDIADVIVFLCSDAARYIHGQSIEINGGVMSP